MGMAEPNHIDEEKRTLILTGASRGIGHATVKRFSSAGCHPEMRRQHARGRYAAMQGAGSARRQDLHPLGCISTFELFAAMAGANDMRKDQGINCVDALLTNSSEYAFR